MTSCLIYSEFNSAFDSIINNLKGLSVWNAFSTFNRDSSIIAVKESHIISNDLRDYNNRL